MGRKPHVFRSIGMQTIGVSRLGAPNANPALNYLAEKLLISRKVAVHVGLAVAGGLGWDWVWVCLVGEVGLVWDVFFGGNLLVGFLGIWLV